MSKITIAGSCYVVTSEVSMADLELVKRHRPKALKLVDEETKEELFAIGTGKNSLNEFGISFGGVSNDEKKLATVTMTIPADAEDATEYVAEKRVQRSSVSTGSRPSSVRLWRISGPSARGSRTASELSSNLMGLRVSARGPAIIIIRS